MGEERKSGVYIEVHEHLSTAERLLDTFKNNFQKGKN